MGARAGMPRDCTHRFGGGRLAAWAQHGRRVGKRTGWDGVRRGDPVSAVVRAVSKSSPAVFMILAVPETSQRRVGTRAGRRGRLAPVRGPLVARRGRRFRRIPFVAEARRAARLWRLSTGRLVDACLASCAQSSRGPLASLRRPLSRTAIGRASSRQEYAPECRVNGFFEPCVPWWAPPADLQAPRSSREYAHQSARVAPCVFSLAQKTHQRKHAHPRVVLSSLDGVTPRLFWPKAERSGSPVRLAFGWTAASHQQVPRPKTLKDVLC